MNASNYTLTENDLNPLFTPGWAAIRQNCTFFASLCCSLLAAVGAVLAKQWLQFYERSGQTGPIDQQAVKRTEKFVGAEKWGLRPVVETLATLLLISLVLFFVALVDYLWSVNKTVSIVVLGFAATGGLLYLLMVVLAAVFPVCPFQTGPSVALRQLAIAAIWSAGIIANALKDIYNSIRVILRPHFLGPGSHSMFLVLYSGAFIVSFPVVCILSGIVTYSLIFSFAILLFAFRTPLIIFERIKPLNMDSLHAYSAILLAESTSYAETVTTVAENIPLISDFEAVQLIATSAAFETLLSQLQRSLQDLQSENNGVDLTKTLSLARAVVHVVLADPRRTTKALEKCLRHLDGFGMDRIGSIPLELHMILSCLRTVYRLGATRALGIKRRDMEEAESLALMEILRSSLGFARAHTHPATTPEEKWWARRPIPVTEGVLPNSTAMLWLLHCAVTATYNRWDEEVMMGLVQDLNDQFLFERLVPDAMYLSRVMDALLAILKWYPLWGARHGHPSLDDDADVQSAWTVSKNRPPITQLLDILNELSRHYATEDPKTFSTFLRCQQRLLVHFNALYVSYDTLIDDHSSSRPVFSLAGQMHSSLNSNLERLLMIKAALQETPERVTISAEGTGGDRVASRVPEMISRVGSPLWQMLTTLFPATCAFLQAVFPIREILSMATIHAQREVGDQVTDREADAASLEAVISCKAEVVRSLQRLLLTSTAEETVNPMDLATTARLAFHIRTIAEKEQLVQGILYSIFAEALRLQPSGALVVGSRYALLQKGPVVGVLLASTLRLYIWLHPSVTPDQAWTTFKSFFQLLITGDTPTVPSVPKNAPEAWNTLVGVIREDHPVRYSCTGLGVLWLASRVRPGSEASQQIDGGRVLDWFMMIMRKVQEDGWMDHVPEELRSSWTIIEKKCAGVLFLEMWDAMVGTNGTGSTTSQLSDWTSSEIIAAFATWLRDYDGQETVEIKLDDIIIMQVPIRPDLINRFVEHAALTNSQATTELGLQSILNKALLTDRNPQGDVSDPGQDADLKKVADVVDVEIKGL
ncbi:hypothetical protein FRB94_014471 [Tulasnella sp. JGI-2019a]|nr:hypothetical protein FRB94_014471 [Tulasnella sp. JGI-2019a]